MKILNLFLIILFSFCINVSALNQYKYLDETFKYYIELKNTNINPLVLDLIIQNTFKVSKESNVDPVWLMALMKVESDYRWMAVSYIQYKPISYGIIQINKEVWVTKQHNKNLITNNIIRKEDDLFNIYYNIRSGAFIINEKTRICKIWKSKNSLRARGFNNVLECVISSYNGTTNKEYFKKVMTSIGEIVTYHKLLTKK